MIVNEIGMQVTFCDIVAIFTSKSHQDNINNEFSPQPIHNRDTHIQSK
jgi:hypothetical protein